MGLNAVAGKPREQWGTEPVRFSDMIPGCYDPHERATDMAPTGSSPASTSRPCPASAAAVPASRTRSLACVQAWNDFVLDEWCAAAPEMFVPMVICQLWDLELAVRRPRAAAKGAKALCFVEDPAPLGLRLPHRPLGAAGAPARRPICPVCMHIGSRGASTASPEARRRWSEIAAAFTYAADRRST